MIRNIIQVSILALVVIVASPLVAQTFRGGVGGTVTDASGAAVTGAAVKLISPATGLTRDTTTSSAGEFVFQDLPLGSYDVTVTQSGFD
ncbi:MAG: carboxypeptidase-like regulatory domain-containing protein, partial [Bryobacteraceae bacterium]